jgi:hypothetical protein
MDAIEGGRGVVGQSRGRKIKLGAEQGPDKTKDGHRDPLESLLDVVRRDMDVALNRAEARFQGARSEAVLRRVLDKVAEEQRREPRPVRAARALTAFGAALWNSRAVRILMP